MSSGSSRASRAIINLINLIKDEKLDESIQMIDSIMIENQNLVQKRTPRIYKDNIKNLFNSILFYDKDVLLEYMVINYKEITLDIRDELINAAKNIYYSKKCLILLEDLENRDELYI